MKTITNKGVKFEGRPIYLDSQATTRIDPRVIDVMNQYHVEQWGNPHSSTHLYGWETEDAVENARKQVSQNKFIFFFFFVRIFLKFLIFL